MASSPAQGQEDVAAPTGAAVGCRPFDDLPADPWRPDALPRARRPSSPADCARSATTPTQSTALGVVSVGPQNPTARVEYALRADEALSEPQVRQIMEYYLAVRVRRFARTYSSVGTAESGSNGNGSMSSGSRLRPTERRGRRRRAPVRPGPRRRATASSGRRSRPPTRRRVDHRHTSRARPGRPSTFGSRGQRTPVCRGRRSHFCRGFHGAPLPAVAAAPQHPPPPAAHRRPARPSRLRRADPALPPRRPQPCASLRLPRAGLSAPSAPALSLHPVGPVAPRARSRRATVAVDVPGLARHPSGPGGAPCDGRIGPDFSPRSARRF